MMKSEAFFKEDQNYPFWIIVSIGIILLFSIYFLSAPIATNSMGILITMMIILATIFLFLIISLRLRVDEEGINIRFRPFVNKEKRIRWDELESVEVRRSNPIMEFGGWGYRMRIKNRAYTLYGNWGLDLQFKNGKRLFIGVQKHEHLHLFLVERIYSKYPELKREVNEK